MAPGATSDNDTNDSDNTGKPHHYEMLITSKNVNHKSYFHQIAIHKHRIFLKPEISPKIVNKCPTTLHFLSSLHKIRTRNTFSAKPIYTGEESPIITKKNYQHYIKVGAR